MKRLHIFLGLLLALLWTTGCSDDDTVLSSGLTIDTTSSVGFDANGGTGTITYTATGAVTATSDQSWLTVSTPSNGTVTFTVAVNDDLASRTGQVTLSCGGETQSVAITQMGGYFTFYGLESSYKFTAEGETLTATYDGSIDVTVNTESGVDWLTVTVEDGELTIEVDENNTGASRSTTISFVGGYKTYTTEILQLSIKESEFYEYFQGDWYLVYGSGSVPVTLVPDADGTGYIMQGLAYDVVVDYDSSTRQLGIVFQYLGMYYGVYDIYWCAWDSSTGYFTWTAGTGANLTFNYDEDSPALIYSDNGVWSGYTCNSFLFYAFSGTPSSSTNVGSIASYSSVSGLYR